MTPKNFQLEGADFLARRRRALLADEPGVGKTGQAILAAHKIYAGSVRVICPGIGRWHWHREFRNWWEWTGAATLPRLEILSFDTARILHNRGLSGRIHRTDVLVLDEAHYAKTPGTGRGLAAFGKNGFGWFSDYIWSLSGTPAPNNASELWPMLAAYGATKMDFEPFKNYFCIVDMMGKVRGTRPEKRQELRDILKPFTLRRLKRDVMPELGEIDIQPWYVEPRASFIEQNMAEDARKQEAALRARIKGLPPEDLLAFLAGTDEFSTLRRYNALLKTPAVYETVMFEVENGLLDKVVIYGFHREPLEILGREFNKPGGPGAVIVYGGLSSKESDGRIQRWKRPDGPRVMLASIISAGVVLDFTESHQGIMLEMDWVNGNNLQAMQRMHRHGQDNPVSVRVAYGSPVDEIISDVLVRKEKDIAGILD